MSGRARHYEIEPVFLPSGSGTLFIICFRPAKATGKALVFCPPFAEETNKSRRMMVLAAQRLAASGVTTVIVDLHGTGDSSGHFADARWSIWSENVTTVIDWLAAERDYGVTLCGVRLGAALALDVARDGERRLDGLVFWQPVVSGSTYMTQFLRMKLAARLHGTGGTTTDELRAQLTGGSSIEVAGYELASDLFAVVDKIDLRDERYCPSIPVRWLEVVSKSRPKPGFASQQVIAAWRDKGVTVSDSVVIGDPFWATTEISLVPGLLDETLPA